MRINPIAPIILALSIVTGSDAYTPAALMDEKQDKKEVSMKGLRNAASDKSSGRSLKGYGEPGDTEGEIPLRSSRKGKVGKIPEQNKDNAVKISKSTKELTYVESIYNIEDGPISGREIVEAWVLENEYISVKGVLLGGNLMSFKDKETDEEYLWLNKEGAVGYAAGSNAFPLTRGLFLHGGIRMAAGTAEHGLYYDTEWDINFKVSDSGNKASLIFSIKDTQKNRDLLNDPLSCGQFCAPTPNSPWEVMGRYPVTDAIYTFKVTLRKGEKFLRVEGSVKNTRDTPIHAEAWIPQTWPVTEHSQVISHQKKRRVKGLSEERCCGLSNSYPDNTFYHELIKDKYLATDQGLDLDNHFDQYAGKQGWIIPADPIPLRAGEGIDEHLYRPLKWPSGAGGILYDYPYMDGSYHAVSFGDGTGRGVAYVTKESTPEDPRFTKMWSWGDPQYFNRTAAAEVDPPLAAGRPATEYYEPWASAFNTAFFEQHEFPPGESSWEARFVPIAEGLDDINMKNSELRTVVDAAVKDAEKSLL